MLRRRVRRVTGTANVSFLVTHGLGQIPQNWGITSWGAARGAGRFRFTAMTTNTCRIINSVASTCTCDVHVYWFGDVPY